MDGCDAAATTRTSDDITEFTPRSFPKSRQPVSCAEHRKESRRQPLGTGLAAGSEVEGETHYCSDAIPLESEMEPPGDAVSRPGEYRRQNALTLAPVELLPPPFPLFPYSRSCNRLQQGARKNMPPRGDRPQNSHSPSKATRPGRFRPGQRQFVGFAPSNLLCRTLTCSMPPECRSFSDWARPACSSDQYPADSHQAD
jgi:hypothetical protein